MKRIFICFFCIGVLLFTNCKSKKKLTEIKKNPKTTENTNGASILEKYSKAIGKPVFNNKLYTFIDKMYGTPHKSKSPAGYDCSGFASLLYREIYGMIISGSSASMYKQCKVIGVNLLEEGDFVFFKINQNNISHVGIYLDNNKFVHASTSSGVMISSLEENYWKKYFFQGGRLK